MTKDEVQIIKKHHDPEWVSYYIKEYDSVIEIDGNRYFAIEKPTIKTSFCFGHGFCGITTDQEEKRAFGMAAKARIDDQFFIEENMKKMDSLVKFMEEADVFCDSGAYNKLFVENKWEACGKRAGFEKLIYREILPEEKEKLVKMAKATRERFKKRLDAYLKRYGLSKVNSWSYLVD